MKKFLVILGITIGSVIALFLCLIGLIDHTGSYYIADPAFPHSYTRTSADNKYVFVMRGPEARDEGVQDERMEKTRLLQNKYAATGLYLNDGSISPLWILKGQQDTHYASKVFISSDGHHLAKTSWWTNSTSDEALTFYRDGKILNSYSVWHIASASWFLPGGHNHYDWDKKITFDDEQKTLTVITEHYDKIVIDMVTGKVIYAIRPLHLIGFLILIFIAYVTLRLYRNKPIRSGTP